MPADQPLLRILNRLKISGLGIALSHSRIKIDINLKHVNFLKARPLLYLLLNKYERAFFIVFYGLPYCLMPDAASHILQYRPKAASYRQTGRCRGCKFADICPGWPNDPGENTGLAPQAVKDLPNEIVLEITQKCNLNCRICFSPKKLRDLKFDKIKKIINECLRCSIKTIRFTGGEPLLHKKIGTMLKYARDKGLYVILNTSATILDVKIRDLFKNNVDNVLISLQGFNTRSENTLTASRVDFGQKIKNIREINRIVPVVRIGTVISRTLLMNFSKYRYLIKKLAIKEWELYRPMGGSEDKEFCLGRGELLEIMKHIKKMKMAGINVSIANAVPYCIAGDFDLAAGVLLGGDADDGHGRLVYDAAGYFKPSYFINKRLGKSIMRSWNSPFQKKIRSLAYLPRTCLACSYLKWCKGGSRYWAKKHYDDYFSPDPLAFK